MRIDCDGKFAGNGVLVAPGEVLTCAHVVHGAKGIKVVGADWHSSVSATARAPELEDASPKASFYPLPDVALLSLGDPPSDHRCARLEREAPAAGEDPDVLCIDSFSVNEHEPGKVGQTRAVLDYVGPFEEGGMSLFKLSRDQVLRGYSGSPALNLRTGSVCALIESTRGEKAPVGGFGVPVAAIEEAFEGLLHRNAEQHPRDAYWARAVAAERAAVDRRAGAEAELPLSRPPASPNWDPGQSRSDLLRPIHRFVGLVGRERLQEALARWRESSDPLGVALLSGEGGYGKTRLALEECAAARRAQWTAGLLNLPARWTAPEIATLASWRGPLLVAIDYADTRPDAVGELLRRLGGRDGGPPVRLLLISRRPLTKHELEGLFAVEDGWEDVERALRGVEPVQLDQHLLDQQDLFEKSVEAFAPLLGQEAPRNGLPVLDGEHFARPLFVLAAAVLWLEDREMDVATMPRNGLMLEMIDRHESRYWNRWNKHLQMGLDPDLQGRAVAAAALLGAESEGEALALVDVVPGLEGLPGNERRDVARWLSHLYGDGRLGKRPAIVPAEPDMLAEALIARECERSEALLPAVLARASGPQLRRLEAVLTRVEQDEGRSPLADLATDAYRSATQRYRELARDDSARYGPELARSLRKLAEVLESRGDREAALAASREAVEQYRGLADG